MIINTTKEEDILIIEIDGDLDASSSIMLDKELEKAVSSDEKKIFVDCSRLNYISSAGLGVFMSYLQDFENKTITLVLYKLSEKVKKVFQILGLDELVKIVNNKEEALSFIK